MIGVGDVLEMERLRLRAMVAGKGILRRLNSFNKTDLKKSFPSGDVNMAVY